MLLINICFQDGHSGKTILIFALESALGESKSVAQKAISFATEIVQEFGADINITSHALYSPLHYACLLNSKEMVNLLLQHDPNVGEKTFDRKTEKDLTTDDFVSSYSSTYLYISNSRALFVCLSTRTTSCYGNTKCDILKTYEPVDLASYLPAIDSCKIISRKKLASNKERLVTCCTPVFFYLQIKKILDRRLRKKRKLRLSESSTT